MDDGDKWFTACFTIIVLTFIIGIGVLMESSDRKSMRAFEMCVSAGKTFEKGECK